MDLKPDKVEFLARMDGALAKLAYSDEKNTAVTNGFGSVLEAREMFDIVKEVLDPSMPPKDNVQLAVELGRVCHLVHSKLSAYLYKISGGKKGMQVTLDGVSLGKDNFWELGPELISSAFLFEKYRERPGDEQNILHKPYFPRSSTILASTRALEAHSARPFLVTWFEQMASKQHVAENIADLWLGLEVPGILEGRRCGNLDSVLVQEPGTDDLRMSPESAVEYGFDGARAIDEWFKETAKARAYILENGSQRDVVRLASMETAAKIYRDIAHKSAGTLKNDFNKVKRWIFTR